LTRRISIKNLTAEIQELREEQQAFRKRLLALEQRELAKDDEWGITDPKPELPIKKMGRRLRITDVELSRRLDELLIRLEGLWPQFLSAREDAKDADEFAKLLEERLPNREGDLVFQKLLRHRKEMWDFVMCDRYNGTYRQFACAMAGVPELKCCSSLPKCSGLLALAEGVEELPRRILLPLFG
jgi:hypothetical protein